LDGGEGRRYNETFLFEGHQWLLVDKQEGVYAGGKAEYTGVRTFEVYADYQKGNPLLTTIDNIAKHKSQNSHHPISSVLCVANIKSGCCLNIKNLIY